MHANVIYSSTFLLKTSSKASGVQWFSLAIGKFQENPENKSELIFCIFQLLLTF